ncbi:MULTISPECIES: chlorophyll a/b-binding protein [unclassified Prochlorococcus]|uniref:chlorophyll a/b-binding protein n=1 Tax=unclassified Prochlorococcus TaxID=2627481 RepID=UPI000533A3C0|nr:MULTISPECIES: chlorophyll a/b-binding protein [unclassified Prochlorococcus]KGG29345.1 putative high light inducible protein [Prochlorococcus sp. MIT 0701]KGG30531.1 putative high light inducible protein [Prochlorococcus sp. MIT 0702]KGG37047.1 putative high light inducible protein [Prochlorococcus sp. MIT 0703]
MTSSSNVITEDGGRQNMYASEPRMQIDPEYTAFSKEAELTNGRWAMIGFLSAVVAYLFTGQILPGVF